MLTGTLCGIGVVTVQFGTAIDNHGALASSAVDGEQPAGDTDAVFAAAPEPVGPLQAQVHALNLDFNAVADGGAPEAGSLRHVACVRTI
jgi:hypothetical protein